LAIDSSGRIRPAPENSLAPVSEDIPAAVYDTAPAPTFSRVAHHTLLNVMGLAVPFLVAFLLLPVITRQLGPARFGLLGLAWAILEYLTLFDLGLNRATVRYAADAIARKSSEVSEISIISMLSQVSIAALAGGTAVLLAPFFARHVFSIPPEMIGEATGVFRVIGLSLPVVLCLTSLRGVLEAAQRFGVSNAIKIPSSAASVVIPAICAPLGMSLTRILLLVLVARLLTCGVLAVMVRRVVPGFRWRWPRDWTRLKTLMSFGGWVAVSSVISPLLVYIDRFALAGLVGIAAVAYYIGPYEAVTKLLLLPISLSTALFPALAGISMSKQQVAAENLFSSALRNVLLVLLPPLTVFAVFSSPILGLWLGHEYAVQSSTALRILAIGVLINGLAQIPYTFLQAGGRPDLTAKFHLGELVLHGPLTWVLVRNYGVNGAATAWLIRVSIDTTLLFIANKRVLRLSPFGALAGKVVPVAAATAVMFAGMSASYATSGVSRVSTLLLLVASLFGFAAIAWLRVLSDNERAMIVRILKRQETRKTS
jgi:O-antigen/teichoic acid export membrane protein